MTRTEKDLIMAQVMWVATTTLALGGIWWFVELVDARVKRGNAARAELTQKLEAVGCKRTGFVPRGPTLVQEVYTCPDGSSHLGEYL